MTILENTDNDFRALLRGQLSVRPGLNTAAGGVDTPEVIAYIRELAANLSRHGYIGGHWMRHRTTTLPEYVRALSDAQIRKIS